MVLYARMLRPNTSLPDKIAASKTFSHLRSKFRLGEKAVLDIGCSEGHYLRHFGADSLGLTLIEAHLQQAQKNGLRVIKADIEDPAFALDEQFDAVWANNLFEHLNAPHLFLAKVRAFLNPEGVLILGVPVLPRVPLLTRFKRFRGAYAVSHVNFFTRQTLIETVRAAGWKVQEARLFYFQSALLDAALNWITPHIYVVARPDPSFRYAEKRLKSLREYTSNSI